MPRLLLLLAVAGLSAGCTAAPTCLAGAGTPMRVFELYFGLAVRGRPDVTEAEWQAFRDRVITANLADGYTVLDWTGAWLNPKTHTTVTDPTKILIAATPDTQASLAAIQRVRAAYEAAFDQLSVGMTSHAACGSFGGSS